MASKAPKARHYSGSESLDYHVKAAACQKNLGHDYGSEVKEIHFLNWNKTVSCIIQLYAPLELSNSIQLGKVIINIFQVLDQAMPQKTSVTASNLLLLRNFWTPTLTSPQVKNSNFDVLLFTQLY